MTSKKDKPEHDRSESRSSELRVLISRDIYRYTRSAAAYDGVSVPTFVQRALKSYIAENYSFGLELL